MRFVSEQPSLASQTIAGATASTGMVRLPSVITVRGLGETTGRASRVIAFQVLTENGRPAVSKGLIEIGG